jgi:hypothetical protein
MGGAEAVAASIALVRGIEDRGLLVCGFFVGRADFFFGMVIPPEWMS